MFHYSDKEAKMSNNIPRNPPDSEDDVHAELEKHFIDEYLRNNNQTRESLRTLQADKAHKIMIEASTYASGKLAEIESRERYTQNVKGAGRNEVS